MRTELRACSLAHHGMVRLVVFKMGGGVVIIENSPVSCFCPLCHGASPSYTTDTWWTRGKTDIWDPRGREADRATGNGLAFRQEAPPGCSFAPCDHKWFFLCCTCCDITIVFNCLHFYFLLFRLLQCLNCLFLHNYKFIHMSVVFKHFWQGIPRAYIFVMTPPPTHTYWPLNKIPPIHPIQGHGGRRFDTGLSPHGSIWSSPPGPLNRLNITALCINLDIFIFSICSVLGHFQLKVCWRNLVILPLVP